MRHVPRTRVAAVLGLVVVGATLGTTGSIVGVGGPLTGDPAAEFVIGDDHVAVRSGGERATVLSNGSDYEAVSIEQTDGGFEVRTDAPDALSERDRARAKQIARRNDTVAAHLKSLDEYTLTVEPVLVVDASSAVTMQTNVSENGSADGLSSSTFTVVTSSSDSVTVERQRTYSNDTAVVVVQRPGEPRDDYEVYVDLANETVEKIHESSRDATE